MQVLEVVVQRTIFSPTKKETKHHYNDPLLNDTASLHVDKVVHKRKMYVFATLYRQVVYGISSLQEDKDIFVFVPENKQKDLHVKKGKKVHISC